MKGNLVSQLLELRTLTINTIEAILAWRKTLWRPHPYMWRGVNYIIKIREDTMKILKSYDVYELISDLIKVSEFLKTFYPIILFFLSCIMIIELGFRSILARTFHSSWRWL